MNFITNFSLNKRSDDVYDFVFVIINRYIKMMFYIFVTKKITIIELTEIIFDHMMFKYDVSKNVVSNKEFVFTNAYWTNICYHMKMKRRLNIVFHSQTNEQIERQNQNLEHFLRRVKIFEHLFDYRNTLLRLSQHFSSNTATPLIKKSKKKHYLFTCCTRSELISWFQKN
jgi:hypothetical protein